MSTASARSERLMAKPENLFQANKTADYSAAQTVHASPATSEATLTSARSIANANNATFPTLAAAHKIDQNKNAIAMNAAISSQSQSDKKDGTLSDSALSNPMNSPLDNKKRRPSVAKALVILGLSKKSSSASNLNCKF